MSTCEQMIRSLQDGEHDQILETLYAQDGTQESLEKARKRAIRVV